MRILFIAIAVAIGGVSLPAMLAFAQSAVSVRLVDGGALVQLEGDFSGSLYDVYRADGADSPFEPLFASQVLCTGSCYVLDPDVEPGATYRYRFELSPPGAPVASYGPYQVRIPGQRVAGVAARVVQLHKSSPSLPILLEGDAAVAYGQIIKIMDAVRRAGIENVGLVLEQEILSQTP